MYVAVKVKVDDVLVLRFVFVVVGVLIGSVGVLCGANKVKDNLKRQDIALL